MPGQGRVLFWIAGGILAVLTGCGSEPANASDRISDSLQEKSSYEKNMPDEKDSDGREEAERIAAIYGSIYEEAAAAGTLGSPDTVRRMVADFGENGYAAVDSRNQVDMAGAEKVLEFCKAVDGKENAEITVIVITEAGFRKYDLKTEDGNVDVVRAYFQYDHNNHLQNRNTVRYRADFWQYTEEGYLSFEGNYILDENFVLTLSDKPEHTMLRVLPLDEKCRELNRKYILPVGYEQNNLFLCNWNEEDYAGVDFYDVFDRFYPILYHQPVPYTADENAGVGAVYRIPEELFETVIGACLDTDRETIRSVTGYVPEYEAYEYRPRGFYEAEYPEIPYPEVVSYTENSDGTITLYINAVYANGNTSREFSHITVVRPLKKDSYQYVSNEIILPEEGYRIGWHSSRLTEEEWQECYGKKER